LLSTGRELARRERLLDTLVVLAPTLLGLGLCLYQLTTRSLWLDESATVAIASQHGAAFGAALAHEGGNMLAYYALLHVLIGLFGSDPLVIRLPAAVAASATVALVGMLALRLGARRVALVAGLLTAVSLSLVYWGQDARAYTPMVALIGASFLALLALLEGRGGWWTGVAYVAATTAAIYVGLEAVLVVPAQLVALVWFRDRWRSLASALALTAVCCVPLAVLAAQRGAGQLFWVPSPSLRVLKQVVQALTSSGLQPSFYTSTTTALLVLTLVVLACAMARTWQLVRLGDRAEAWRPGLMLAWLLVPAVAALIESAVGHSIFQARYLLVSLPVVSLLLAWAVFERSARVPGMRWLSLGAVAALIALRALQLAPAYGVSSENWRAATSYVIANRQSRDCIAFYPVDGRMAFRYYLRSFTRAPRPILPALRWPPVRPFVEDYASLSSTQLARLPRQCGRVWLLVRHGGGAGGTAISHVNYVRLKQLTFGLSQQYPISRTAGFGQAGLLTVTRYSR
jgi:uncharacterized membrane protein